MLRNHSRYISNLFHYKLTEISGSLEEAAASEDLWDGSSVCLSADESTIVSLVDELLLTDSAFITACKTRNEYEVTMVFPIASGAEIKMLPCH